MLNLNNVEVKYLGLILVLRGISLQVPGGGIVALLGANGAGKTTTLKAISGLLLTEQGSVTKGSIEFEGVRIDGKNAEDIVRRGIVQVMEGRRIFQHLTTEENLIAGCSDGHSGISAGSKLEMIYRYFPPLKELRQRTAGYLSGGEQQMLVVGRALMSDPRLLLLDEVSLGLAPLVVRGIFDIIKAINYEQKVSLLLVEQNARAALEIAQYVYVLEDGKIVLEGAAEYVKDNEDVKEFYLGLSAVGKRSYKDVKHYKRRKRWLG